MFNKINVLAIFVHYIEHYEGNTYHIAERPENTVHFRGAYKAGKTKKETDQPTSVGTGWH
jgi:hypothetical protein